MIGRDGDALHGDERLDPFASPGPVAVRVKVPEWAERQSSLVRVPVAADVIVVAAGSQCQRHKGVTLVEGEDLRMLVATELRGDQCQKCRFTRARGTEDQGVSNVIDMEIEPERRRAACNLHQWWRIRGVEWARRHR